MFNVCAMLPKSGGLKILRKPRILLLGSARTSFGLLKPGVDRLFGEEHIGISPLLCPAALPVLLVHCQSFDGM